ncbi:MULTISPECIES: hypothetical protein [Candidatus Kuenenia]|uniref:Uncharacterized protein n=1 Tax=Kuenenia stuttgartiensis TaxID=174633 RepID=A0A2C9CGA3_KUEST|nr:MULTISPECIES: hypothetical protein [Kuenenia]MBE7546058.1 hypothetical protein [Planctomycetia bacterium]MCL4728491.1 hypothetical protein [Candidatus Kuenenia stuttgartiensis]MCZ7621382.1 hypothetical protein [Candidatus Kuenenia sp.]SOH04774.1 hypothetical protein KSMBR1_2279 [Candidatus Kuenenia stuttgartiensis]
MKVITEKEELYKLIKEAVREVLHEEIVEIFLKNIPLISKEEMKDIENLYGKPSLDKIAAFSETIEI